VNYSLVSAYFCVICNNGINRHECRNYVGNGKIRALAARRRTVEEYTNGHIPTSINMPLKEIETRLSRLFEFKDSPVVVYCRSGLRAGKAIAILEDNGFTNVMHLEGDMLGWEAENRSTNQLGK
jgi:rhodanese-related sulfurtransferase